MQFLILDWDAQSKQAGLGRFCSHKLCKIIRGFLQTRFKH